MFRSGGVWAELIDSLALTGFPAVSASGSHLSLSVSAWAHLNVPHHTYATLLLPPTATPAGEWGRRASPSVPFKKLVLHSKHEQVTSAHFKNVNSRISCPDTHCAFCFLSAGKKIPIVQILMILLSLVINWM